MPLPTSGSLSLDQIHVEAGGTSTTTASINDTDIRGLIDKGSAVTMAFNEWYGATANIAGQATINIAGSGTTTYTLPVGVETICVLIVMPGEDGNMITNQVTAGWGGGGGNLGYWNHISVNGAGSSTAPQITFSWKSYVNYVSPYYDYGYKLRTQWYPGGNNTPYTTWNQNSGAQYQDQAHTRMGIKMDWGSNTNPGYITQTYSGSTIYKSTNVDANGTIRGGRGGYGAGGEGSGGGAAGYSGNGGNGGGSNNSAGDAGSGGGGGGAGGTSAYMYGVGVGQGAGGGGVGILGPGANGAGGVAGSSTGAYGIVRGGSGGSGGGNGGTVERNYSSWSGNGNGGDYGGGAGGGGAMYPYGGSTNSSPGGDGVVRLMWGNNRAYPSTNVADQ